MMDVKLARLLTLGLGSACGVLVVTALIQLAGYGRGYGWLPADTAESAELAGEIDRTPIKIPPLASYVEVESRPLFNDDRKPTPVSEEGPVVEGPPPAPLNVTLTGVVLVRETDTTPELKVAMVRDNLRNETMALKVGMPLGGDQAGWTLVELAPRLATFRNVSDETVEIELNPAAGTAPAQPASGRPAPPRPNMPPPDKNADPAASDLARRIEERRRQMREQAERLRSQRGNSPTEQKN